MIAAIDEDKKVEKEVITQEQQQGQGPIYSFMYTLKSTEARRQYPKRLSSSLCNQKNRRSLGSVPYLLCYVILICCL
jgi:hypothetical protein